MVFSPSVRLTLISKSYFPTATPTSLAVPLAFLSDTEPFTKTGYFLTTAPSLGRVTDTVDG